MIQQLIDAIQNAMLTVFRHEEIVTVFIAMLPIVEARLAIPMAIDMGITPLLGWFYAFIGSCFVCPVILALFLPILNALRRTKFFKKIGDVIYEKFEKKSRKIRSDDAAEGGGITADDSSKITTESDEKTASVSAAENARQSDNKKKRGKITKSELKKMLGVFTFVAIPLPLTGVWTGSAVAAIVNLRYSLALAAVVAGNLVASAIILLLTVLFSAYIDIIILVIGIIAVLVVIALIIRIILHKPDSGDADGDNKENK